MGSTKVDSCTPTPLKINGLYLFFSEMAYCEGEPEEWLLGPFLVRGEYKIERSERDIPVQRFLIIKPEKGCVLPMYEEYVVEYPEKLIAGDFISFERKKSACRIRVKFEKKEGEITLAHLHLHKGPIHVSKYVLYECQVEGTWIPIEADGRELKP